jgi:hypothetical protein
VSTLVELASPERITAVGAIVTGLFGAWLASEVRSLKAKVTKLEEQQEKDQGVIRSALRHIRDLIAHNALLSGLLRIHAPTIAIPDAPALPDELKDEV